MPTKAQIRKAELSKREEASQIENEAILINLLSLPELLSADTVFCYFSVRNEIPTDKIIFAALEMGKRVALPVTNEDFSLDFYYITADSVLLKGKFNVPEPEKKEKAIPIEKSLCVVPALAVNERGHRIGYGKGCYDRFLNNIPGFSVALVYERGMTDFTESENDIPLDAAITEKHIIKF